MRRDQSSFETVTSSSEFYSVRCAAAPLREISVKPSLWQKDVLLSVYASSCPFSLECRCRGHGEFLAAARRARRRGE
jgi:hypothetical protein